MYNSRTTTTLIDIKCVTVQNNTAAFHLLLMAGDISVNPSPINSPSYTLPELHDMLSKKGLSILHQNIRGLLANKDNVCRVLDDFHKIQILSLSETHLSTDDEPQAQIDGYSFISKPRKSAKGGGVGAYISSSVTYHRRLDLQLDDIECLWIEVLFPKSKGFLMDLFIVLQIHRNIFPKILIANWNQCLRTSLWRTKNAF